MRHLDNRRYAVCRHTPTNKHRSTSWTPSTTSSPDSSLSAVTSYYSPSSSGLSPSSPNPTSDDSSARPTPDFQVTPQPSAVPASITFSARKPTTRPQNPSPVSTTLWVTTNS